MDVITNYRSPRGHDADELLRAKLRLGHIERAQPVLFAQARLPAAPRI